MPYLGCWIHAKVLVLGVVLLENWELIATVFLKEEEEEDAGPFIFRFIFSLVISRKVGKSNSSYIVFGGIQRPTQSLARKHISTTWIPLFSSQKWIFSIKVAAGTFAHALPKGVPHCHPECGKKRSSLSKSWLLQMHTADQQHQNHPGASQRSQSQTSETYRIALCLYLCLERNPHLVHAWNLPLHKIARKCSWSFENSNCRYSFSDSKQKTNTGSYLDGSDLGCLNIYLR